MPGIIRLKKLLYSKTSDLQAGFFQALQVIAVCCLLLVLWSFDAETVNKNKPFFFDFSWSRVRLQQSTTRVKKS